MNRSLRAFVRLSRVKFLAGGLVAGALGTAIAAHTGTSVDWAAFALAQSTIGALHLMTHYANDYFDRDSDVRTLRTPFSGGSGVLVDGSLPPWIGLLAALVCLSGGGVGIAVLLARDRWVAAGFAVAMALVAWAYSAPPLRLLARGIGELAAALVVAVLVPLCTLAAQNVRLDAQSVASTLPGAAAMLLMMLAVEAPDLAADAATAKRNLVVRLGPVGVCPLGNSVLVAVYALTAVAVVVGAPWTLALFEALTLPLAFNVRVALARWAAGDATKAETLAGTGVAFFFIVELYALLAYLAVD